MRKWLQLRLIELMTDVEVELRTNTRVIGIQGVMMRSKHRTECRDKVNLTRNIEPRV